MPEETPTDSIPVTPQQVTARYPRVAITGEPRCGKSTISKLVTDCPVIHTDPNDLKAAFADPDDTSDWSKSPEVWAAAPAFIGQMCTGRERFLVEGVTVARALRRGTIAVDAVILCTEPIVERTAGQDTMGKGTMKIFEEWREANPNVPVFDGGPMVPRLVTRYAAATLDAATIQRTPQGGIRVKARLTKVGVFEYNRDGFLVREYRPPEEVLSGQSLATLKGATVVVDHPYLEGGEVNPDNFKELTVGHCEDPQVDADGNAAWGWLNINDADTIRDIEQGKLVEVSCGYENSFEDAKGTTPSGEQYDRIQRNISYNHIALGPRGWGRQGADVALSLDANDNQLPAGSPASIGETMDPKKKSNDADDKNKPDKTSDQGAPSGFTDDEIAALKSLAALAPALAAYVQQAPAPVPAAAPAQAPAPVAPTMDQQPPAPVVPAAPAASVAPQAPVPPKTMDAADIERVVEESVGLRREAERVIGDSFVPKGKSNRQIRLEVIKTVDSGFSDKRNGKDLSDPEIGVAYDFALKMHADRERARGELGDVRNFDTTTDGADAPTGLNNMVFAYQAEQRKQRAAGS